MLQPQSTPQQWMTTTVIASTLLQQTSKHMVSILVRGRSIHPGWMPLLQQYKHNYPKCYINKNISMKPQKTERTSPQRAGGTITWEESSADGSPVEFFASSSLFSTIKIFFMRLYWRLSSSRTASFVRKIKSKITVFDLGVLTNWCWKRQKKGIQKKIKNQLEATTINSIINNFIHKTQNHSYWLCHPPPPPPDWHLRQWHINT